MEALHSSETSLNTTSTRRHTPEDGFLQVIYCSYLLPLFLLPASLLNSDKVACSLFRVFLSTLFRNTFSLDYYTFHNWQNMCVMFSASKSKQNVNDQIFGSTKLVHLPMACYLVPLYLPEKAWLFTMAAFPLTIRQSRVAGLLFHTCH
jgi:hypothetical protein